MNKHVRIFPTLMLFGALTFDLCAMQSGDDKSEPDKSRPSAQSTRFAEGFSCEENQCQSDADLSDEDASLQRPPRRSHRSDRNANADSSDYATSSNSKAAQSHHNAGLINDENICYLNAVVQCLSNLRDFRRTLLTNEAAFNGYPLVSNLISLFKDLRTTDKPAIKNNQFIYCAKGLIEMKLENEEKTVKDSDSVVDDSTDKDPAGKFLSLLFKRLLRGEDKQDLFMKIMCTIECLDVDGAQGCKNTKEFDVSKVGVDLECQDLENILAKHFSPRFSEEYFCTRCYQKNASTIDQKISRYPNELVITLKRFDSLGNRDGKKIFFPIELNLKPYATENLQAQADANSLYELVGFVSRDDTHYISFVKDFEDGNWYLYDDANVTQVDEAVIKQIATANLYIGSNPIDLQEFIPYILFYHKKKDIQQSQSIESIARIFHEQLQK